jgi:hypothetical protein
VVPSILIIELNSNSPWLSVPCTSDEVIVKSIRLCSAYSFFFLRYIDNSVIEVLGFVSTRFTLFFVENYFVHASMEQHP